MPGYRQDLAYIHDARSGDYVLKAAPGLLDLLRRGGIARGLVVDLGCGSGRWARDLQRAGYSALGIDQSAAMIRLARRVAPACRFRRGSLWSAELPACDAVTAIGECLNYMFEDAPEPAVLFERIHRALRPGGILIFDAAAPARAPSGNLRLFWSEEHEWAVMWRTSRGDAPDTLVRDIVSFRKVGRLYRRSAETHRLRLFEPHALQRDLANCGFESRVMHRYGAFRLPRGMFAIVAVKSRPSRA